VANTDSSGLAGILTSTTTILSVPSLEMLGSGNGCHGSARETIAAFATVSGRTSTTLFTWVYTSELVQSESSSRAQGYKEACFFSNRWLGVSLGRSHLFAQFGQDCSTGPIAEVPELYWKPRGWRGDPQSLSTISIPTPSSSRQRQLEPWTFASSSLDPSGARGRLQ
jgi:hypothetical protein